MSSDATKLDIQDHSAPVRAGEELDLARLEPFLHSHFPDAAGPLMVRQFPSGHSNLTYSVKLGSHEMVLRRPPFGSKVKSAHDMGREYRVLSRLHKVFPAPQALLYCDDLQVIGAPFYPMERIHGVVLRRGLPQGLQLTPEMLRKLNMSFIDTLAGLHAIDYAAIGLGDLGKPEGYLERQVRGWIERYYGSQTHDIPEVETLAPWLRGHLPPPSGATLIHNDYKYDNMVLDAADVTCVKGVLDWEMCTIGDPLADLGTAIGYWIEAGDSAELKNTHWRPTSLPGCMTRAELVERYAQQTGRNVSRIVYYYIFALFKTAVILQQIYYRYHHGLTRDARFAGLLDLTKILLRTAVHSAEKDRL